MRITLLSFFVVLSTALFGQLTAEQKIEKLKEDVAFLASDKLAGRETGTKGEEQAATYIAKRFKKLGLEPKGEKGYYQSFSFKPTPNPHGGQEYGDMEPIEGKNVIGFIDRGAKTTVVIGAHYDHLGEGGEGSLYAGDEPQIHNGADDNASGVAIILALAEELVKRTDLANNNYLIIGFSGEEKGLWGSNYFTKHPTVELENVNYMINLDMVGRYRPAKGLAINGTGTSPIWKEKIDAVNQQEVLIVSDESGIGPSDHTSFYLKEIPVLHFFTGQHEDYHKPTDDIDKVNYEGMLLIKEFIVNLISALNWEGELEYAKTQKKDSQKAPKFSVTLGVMPDYMFQGEGMRIDGVIDDRPAKKAGIEAGDVVIQMGDVKVDNMQGYMKALSTFKKGDIVLVTIIRNEKEKQVQVEF